MDEHQYFESDDFDIYDINSIPTNIVENISKGFRDSQGEPLQRKSRFSLNFQERLDIDTQLNQLLEHLMKAKIELMEISEPGIIQQNQTTKTFLRTFEVETKKYLKTLLLREAQLGSLVFILDHQAEEDFEKRYLQQYGDLDKFIIRPQNAHKKVNIFVLEQAFETELEFMSQFFDMISLMKLNVVHKKYLENMEGLIKIANKFKVINSKIATIAEIFPFACNLSEDDLFSYPKTSNRWKRLFGRWIRHKLYGDKQSVQDSFMNLKGGVIFMVIQLNIVNATMSIIHRTKQSWSDGKQNWASLMKSTTSILKCVVYKKDAEDQANILFSAPDKKLTKQIWNLPEQAVFRNLIATILPSIAMSEEFWIPRLFIDYLAKGGCIQIPQLLIANVESYLKSIREKYTHDERLRIRVNSPYYLQTKFHDQKNNQKGSWLNPFSWWGKKKGKIPMKLIYHIHGGGFISMSSFIHQTYTRLWANNLEVPIISVDYGKAPQYPYPNGLYDCFEGYMWMLYCFRQIFQVQPTKVIIVGDSAGGNLVAALTNLLMKMGVKGPDGIVLVYPALNLNLHNYTPSLLTSLNDMILPHTFLKICLEAYLPPDQDPVNDYYISPIATPNQLLQKYPPTRIFVGSKDPFHDDCCRLIQKMNDCKEDNAKLIIFQEFPHGFLQFDVKTQPHQESRKAVKEVENALSELLEMQK